MPAIKPAKASASPVVPDLSSAGDAVAPAVRTLTLSHAGRVIGTLQYHLSAAPLATVQLLHFEVAPDHRRQGHASRLFHAAVDDAKALLGPAVRLRRIHTGVGHKSHIAYRAFLTHVGFHHVSTTPGLYRGEDMLTYIKSYT